MSDEAFEDVRAFVETMPDDLRAVLRAHGISDAGVAAMLSAVDAPLDAPTGTVFAMAFIAGALWGRHISGAVPLPCTTAPS